MIVVTLAQVAVGTQVRGHVDDALDAGVARPQALATVGMFDSVHRTTALAVMSLALMALLVVWSKHPHEKRIAQWTYAVVALAAMQIVLGAVLAFVALAPPFQVLHLTVASLLMGAQMVQLLVAWWDRIRRFTQARRRAMSRVWSATVAGMSLVWSMACSSPPPPASPAGAAADHAAHVAADAVPARTDAARQPGQIFTGDSDLEHRGSTVLRRGADAAYGFNHDESFRSFAAGRGARRPRPDAALGHGARARHQHQRSRAGRSPGQQAYTHLAAAQARAANGSPVEQALIAALSKRYVANPDAAIRRRASRRIPTAMGEVARRFPTIRMRPRSMPRA